MLYDRVLPFYQEQGLPMLRILTDRGAENRGKAEQHVYQLFLSDIEYTKTKVRSPQTNGICVRFHKAILNEFYHATLRMKIYSTVEELQIDLDEWLVKYNTR